ncbi:hypothetical protein ROLI_028430 [Roseobacter fucihabitans]|uniref:DUF3307 domain-containing protein n=1 Tax=Roseobacter fucihabitans TaxID=1537242 RepID=A0ABZ2BWJ6_9RHOB|nr:DUF3307 domain-containing protein [Roseobacter litoralis]MBC6964762.1 hypothetical protein [Roseobacter litoralis]
MGEDLFELLILLCLLQIKHMLADYFLQTSFMLEGRARYRHMGRLLHAGIHALGSVMAFLLLGTPVVFILLVVVLEGVVHFHIDWCKGRFTYVRQLTPNDAAFWRASGVDQALHQLTYVAMLWAWLVWGNGATA